MAQTKFIKLKVNKVLKILRKIIFISLLVLTIISFLFTFWNLKERYLSFDYWKNFPSLEKTFLSSQYVNKHPAGWIPDETAFSYAGGKLIQGTSPVLVVPDAPPLGKYLIGLSAIIFNNDAVIVLISAAISLVLLFLLGFQIFKDKALAMIPVFLFSLEPIFTNQLKYVPLLDLFQLVFILSGFYFFNKGFTGKKIMLYFFLASLFLGFFIATKFFISGFVVIASWYLVLLYNKEKERLVKLTASLPLALFILLLSYIRVFAFGYTINKFLGIQKWVYLYHQSFLILPFSVWPLILFNKWYVWFGDKPVISDGQWIITWPFLTVLSIITLILYVLKKIPQNRSLEILMAWFAAYMLFLSLGQTFSRYFVILIPVLYIISVYGLVSLYKIYKK